MAQKGKTKIRDLGKRKSGSEIAARYEQASQKGFRSLRNDLRLKEKRANERMRQLEIAGIKSPAYQAVQAQLEVLGRQTKGDRGRRFSETGKATYNEAQYLDKILDEFLGYETSTVKGAREYRDEVWSSANKNNILAEAGITRDDWFDFWESMPDRKDRLYGSSQIVAMVRAYRIKQDKLTDELAELKKLDKPTRAQLKRIKELEDMDAMSVQEIAEEIQASKNLKDAYKKLGLDWKEAQGARIKMKPSKGSATSRAGIAEI